jgi:hypothetical protein
VLRVSFVFSDAPYCAKSSDCAEYSKCNTTNLCECDSGYQLEEGKCKKCPGQKELLY